MRIVAQGGHDHKLRRQLPIAEEPRRDHPEADDRALLALRPQRDLPEEDEDADADDRVVHIGRRDADARVVVGDREH